MRQAEFDQLLEDHQEWQASLSRAGKMLSVDDADLRDLEMAGSDLSECELYGCDLRGCVLDSADLVRSRLYASVLDGASLLAVDLYKAELHDVSATGADWGSVRLRRAELYDCDLRRGSFRRANLFDTDFFSCDLRQTAFDEVDGDRMSFRGSVFEEDSLARAFAGSLGSVVRGDAYLETAAGRRDLSVDDLILLADAGDAALSIFDVDQADAFTRPWRWAPPRLAAYGEGSPSGTST